MENLKETHFKILTRLLFFPKSRFKHLNTDSLTTDNFSYYIRTLIATGLIKKDGSYYSLTSKGKMVAGKIDTQTYAIEKQPKVSVIIIPTRVHGGKKQYLIQQRRKEPYFGYWGFFTGKVRFGETVVEAGMRELSEETGLEGKINFCFQIHEMVYDKDTKDLLEDKFFQVLEAKNLIGELKLDNEEGFVKFVTEREFRKIQPKFHSEDEILSWYLESDFAFKEEKYYIEKF